MYNNITFSTPHHTYIYSYTHKEYIPVHPILKMIVEKCEQDQHIGLDHFLKESDLQKYTDEQIRFYWNKYQYLRSNQFIGVLPNPEFGKLSAGTIQKQIANLGVLTFEVTDKCNLRCRYCTYGEMYYGYDARIGNDLEFAKAKQLLDFLFDVWKRSVSLTNQRTIVIGFYGGEPLLNMKFIRQVVEYIALCPLQNITFTFNMTTNSLLLDRYMDFLVEHRFHLLLSLDGDREADNNRILANGKESFDIVFKNIKSLKTRYPDYFEKYVAFNTVYHSGSDIDKILAFFKTEFDKTPSLSELNNSSIADKAKFEKMHKSVYNSIAASSQSKEIDQQLMYASPRIGRLTYFLHHLTSEVFRDYRSMFYKDKKYSRLPGGTCIPFNRKLFLTVNGRILPCERIDHDFSIGEVGDHVKLDLEEIAATYNAYYDKITKQCRECYMFSSCSQCLFYTDVKPHKIICHNFKNRDQFAEYLTQNVKYLENSPWAYEKVMKEVTLF